MEETDRASKVEAFVTGTLNMEPKAVRELTGVPESTLHRWRAGNRSLSEENEERVDAYLAGKPMGESRESRTDAKRTADPLAADLERIYQEFDTSEDRLLARENLAAMMRADAAKAEAHAAEGQARAREREGEAAKIRARALYLAERRALLMCRRTKTPSGDGDRRDGTPDAAPPQPA